MKQNIPQVYQLGCPVESFDDICYNIKITKYDINVIHRVLCRLLINFPTLANSRLMIVVLDIATSALTTTQLGLIILQLDKGLRKVFFVEKRLFIVRPMSDRSTI